MAYKVCDILDKSHIILVLNLFFCAWLGKYVLEDVLGLQKFQDNREGHEQLGQINLDYVLNPALLFLGSQNLCQKFVLLEDVEDIKEEVESPYQEH